LLDAGGQMGEARDMAYRAPSFIVKHLFNPLAMRLGIGGSQKLRVRRRRSGGLQEVPVITLEQDGARYLVSARGETDWVKNLRAAGGEGELDGAPFTSTEVAPGERAAILDAYQRKAGRAVEGHFSALPDPADHPVFRLA
jgi:hypothetical protein